LPSVLLATAWWWIPLLVLGKFAYPFLDYIESAAVTTSVTSGINDLRGTDQWLAFVIGSVGPVWPAGLWLAAAVAGVVCTAIAAGLGLAGLVAAPAGRIRSWLAASILVGACVLMIGYAGAGGSLVAVGFQELLDGPLAPFRNIHKFDPLIRLPLALGLAVALSGLDRRLRVSRTPHSPRSGSDQHRQATVVVAVGCAVMAVVGVMLPALRGDLAAPLSFEKVPQAQVQAASAMSKVPGRTLLVPGSAFGEYAWGRPLDEPMQALAQSPWAIRTAIPLGAPGATRWLDGIQALLSSGTGQRELASVLRAAGISQVLLRNDLLPASRTLPGAVVRATLIASPGLHRSAGFGDLVPAASGVAALPIGGGKQARALEIFAVEQEPAVARHVPMTAVRRYVGGPEAATSNLGLGVAPVARPDGPDGLAPGGTIITDTLRRRALNFGAQVGHDYGPTVPAWQDVQGNRPAADVSPYPAGEMETVVTYQGIESVTASSTAASPFGEPNLGPQYRPFAALVGDPGSSWLSSAEDPEPTLTVRFGRDVPAEVSMNLAQQTVGRSEVDRVELVTDAGTASARPGTSTSVLLKVAGVTRSMRIVLHRAGPATIAIGLDSVSIPGVEPREVYEQVAPGDEISLRVAPGGRRACVDPGRQWLCAKELADPGEELQPLDRRVTLRGPLRSTLTAAVVPVQGRRLNALLDRSMGVSVAGSSQLLKDAAARPGAALDQDGATAWIVASKDNRPTLKVTFPKPRTITAASAFVDNAQSIGVRSMVISSAGSTRTVLLGRAPDRMSPLTGTTFTIAFPRAGTDSMFFKSPMAVRSVNLQGSGITGLDSTPVRLPCGQAGTVIFDGREIPLAAELTPGKALAGGAVPGRPCGGEVSLPTGTRHIWVEPGSAMVAESVQLLRANPSDLADSVRPVDVTEQSEEHAAYHVTAGPDGILVVPQSYNIGWRARVGDQVLAPVMVAG
ncbi:MAG: arabinofuranan 3-O-arabinosyltransferase, partial [Actinomycetota bacterium]|nr:arabinofuranan 3-O-arabinosyltransferase [Actinomycetota bacterium]